MVTLFFRNFRTAAGSFQNAFYRAVAAECFCNCRCHCAGTGHGAVAAMGGQAQCCSVKRCLFGVTGIQNADGGHTHGGTIGSAFATDFNGVTAGEDAFQCLFAGRA